MLAINGESAGLGAGRERPLGFHFELRGIDRDQFALVFDVDEDFSLGVAGGELGLAVEFNRAENGAIGRIDGGGILAASVEGEDALGGGIVEDGVGIFASFYFAADSSESLDVENCDRSFAAVADETASELGSEGDTVNARSVRDVADALARSQYRAL